MRTLTGPEATVLAGTTYWVTPRIKVANGSGTMIDVTTYMEYVTIDQDIDQPVSGATITFRRDSSTTSSLAPLRTDSTLNVNDVPVYSPLLDIGRSITIEVATTALGTAPGGGDYKLLFKGTTDVVNFEQSPVSIICRDLGAPLVDRWVETETTYGSGGGTAIQTVMQNILDAVFGGGAYTLYVPVSPGFNVVTYRQQKMSVMDALQDLAQLIGWDIRYKWDDGTSAFRLTLSEPPRTKTTPDYTFGPSSYFDITQLNLDITNIRNVITGSYKNSADFGNRAAVTVSDSSSITKYGRRFFYIQEADISPIDTSAEMTAMLNAALADMKDPKAEQEVDMPFFWPADISDLYRYSPNSVHYNTNQDIAVVELTHELSENRHRTRARVRGTPAGQYISWLAPGGTIGGPTAGGAAKPPYPYIAPLNTEPNELSWDLRFNAVNGSGGGGANLTYTITSKKSFGSVSTLDSGNASAFPKTLAVTRHPKASAVLIFSVTDAATGMTAEATWPIPSIRGEINDAGNASLDNSPVAGNRTAQRAAGMGAHGITGEEDTRGGGGGIPVPFKKFITEPYYDYAGSVPLIDTTTREILSGLEIGSGVKGKADVVFGSTVRYPVSRHNENIYGVHTDSKSFANSYESIPQIRVLPDTFTLPSTGEGSPRKIEMKATSVTVSGFSVRAVSSTGSSSAAQSENPSVALNGTPVASVLLNTDLEPAYWNLANANATLTTYTAHYDVDTSGDSGVGLMVVRLYKNDGTGSTNWTEVASRSYSSGDTWIDEQLSFDAAMAADWDIRIVMDLPGGSGWLNTTVTAKACTYNKITAGTETSLTSPAGSQLLVQAMEQV